jgi:hypothetical protein
VHAAFLPISVAAMQVSLAVALGATALAWLAGVRTQVGAPLAIPVLLFGGAGMLAVVLAWAAGNPPQDLYAATLWKSFVTPLVIASALGLRLEGEDVEAPRRRALAAVTIWSVAALVAGGVSVVQPWTGFDPLVAVGTRGDPVQVAAERADWPGHFHAVGFFHWYSVLPLNLLPPLALALGLGLLAPLGRWRRALFLGAGAAAGAASILSLARIAWGSLAAMCGVLLGAGRRRLGVAAAAVALAGAVALVAPGVRLRVENGANVKINADRLLIWRVCGAVVRDHPLVGIGPGNFPVVSQRYFDRIAPWFKVRSACHDSSLTFLVEGGPLLLAASLAYWILLARAFLRARRTGDALGKAAATAALAAIAGAVVNGLVHDPFHTTPGAYAMGFAFGIAWVLVRPPTA